MCFNNQTTARASYHLKQKQIFKHIKTENFDLNKLSYDAAARSSISPNIPFQRQSLKITSVFPRILNSFYTSAKAFYNLKTSPNQLY